METNIMEAGLNINDVEPIKVPIASFIDELKAGVTRCKGDTGYDPAIGSIEEKYGLSKDEVKTLFSHPKLKNIRVKVYSAPKLIIVDEEEEVTLSEIKSKYGKPSAAGLKRIAATTNTTI